MTIPAWLFEIAIWAAIGGVAIGAVFLLAMVIREWRSGRLW